MIGEKRKITHGPWQVIREEYPHHLGGKHVEFRIFTTWSHPQLKGPMPVVNGSVGIGAEKGGPARHMVWIDEADAYLIAAAPELLEKAQAALAACDRIVDQYKAVHCGIDFRTLGRELSRAIDKATTIPSPSQGTTP